MEYIDVEIVDRVATVTFDRPPVNALNAQAFREIAQAFTALRHGTDVHVAIFTAAGDRMLCAESTSTTPRGATREDGCRTPSPTASTRARSCATALGGQRLPAPGDRCVDGAAWAAGLALVACCDVIIAVEDGPVRPPRDQRRCPRRWAPPRSAWSARTRLARCSTPASSSGP